MTNQTGLSADYNENNVYTYSHSCAVRIRHGCSATTPYRPRKRQLLRQKSGTFQIRRPGTTAMWRVDAVRIFFFFFTAPWSDSYLCHAELVNWYSEPSQPQRITSRLKIMFNLSPIYSARKSSNHKLSINHKISHNTNLHKTIHTQTSNTKFSKN